MTTKLFEMIRHISRVLDEIDTPWALIGGLAVSIYVEPRFTRDIDIVLAVDDDQHAERFIVAWRHHGFTIDTIIKQDAVDRLATVRTYRIGDPEGIIIDLLFASSGIELEITQQAQTIELIADLPIPIARPGHLFALKTLSSDPTTRPLDAVDLQNLKSIMTEAENHAAREAARLIQSRGYHRGRDVPSMIEELLATER